MNSSVSTFSKPGPSRVSLILAAGFRAVFVAVLFTALGMALGLFTGIVLQMLRSFSGGVDMTVAYRHVAFPTAVTFGIVALLTEGVIEFRSLRRRQHA